MNISSRSLFHYTSTAEVVKLILKGGLRFSRLEEELPLSGYASNIFDQLPGVVKHVQFRDGVCLCDLPLHSTNDHREQYGKHALGFSKEWGMRARASPVRYVHRASPDVGSEFFNTILDTPREIDRTGSVYHLFAEAMGIDPPDLDSLPADQRQLLDGVDQFCRELLQFNDFSASFLRVYDGEWDDRATGETTHRRFYDEREWRIVRSPGHGDYVQFTNDDLTHVFVGTDAERCEVIDFAVAECPNLGISNQDDFARKVRTFAETFDET